MIGCVNMAHKIIKMNSLMFFQACLNVDHHQIEYLGHALLKHKGIFQEKTWYSSICFGNEKNC